MISLGVLRELCAKTSPDLPGIAVAPEPIRHPALLSNPLDFAYPRADARHDLRADG